MMTCWFALAHASPDDLIAHEWGTFTAVAGVDGAALDWRPLDAPADLPPFVHTIDRHGPDRDEVFGKGDLIGTVRMETPVIYFYPPSVMDVEVSVTFPSGRVTEWYPWAEEVGEGGVDWGTVRLFPSAHREAPPVPPAEGDSHYFTARVPEAATVRVCGRSGSEAEDFLFYRGVGSFPLSLRAVVLGDRLQLSGPPGDAVVFERQGNQVGVEVVRLGSFVEVQRPTLDDDQRDAFAATRRLLTASGLYPAEVEAMLATWDDDWFEDGLRVFHVLPRPETDALLPLRIEPAPGELVRTLVGRVEIVTPERRASLMAALRRAPDAGAGAEAVARAWPRFAEPALRSIESGGGADGALASAALAELRP